MNVDTALAGDVRPWLATEEEVQDVQILHALAPAATIRVVLVEPTALKSPASAMERAGQRGHGAGGFHGQP